jgi:hypothetical protein
MVSMAKRATFTDFRTTRVLLPDEAFALVGGKRPGPTDLVAKDVWNGIMHLPDDVAITTSNHHGSQLAALYTLWGDWVEAMGNTHDELFTGMLDAADCFQASTFESLHGYYRSSLSNLRTAIELVAIGTLGNLSPIDRDYVRWKKQNVGSLPLASSIRKLRSVTKAPVSALIFKPNGWMEALYNELCAYTRSRPDSSDGEMWSSNGPVYVTVAANLVFELQASTYATCYLLAKIGRPNFGLPAGSEFLFTTPDLLWRDDIAASYHTLCSILEPPHLLR